MAYKIDFTATALPLSSSSGFSVGGIAKSILGGKIVYGYLQISGNFSTSEVSVGFVSLPSVPVIGAAFRGGVDATASRTGVAMILDNGEIRVQMQDSFSGNVWFTFCIVTV